MKHFESCYILRVMLKRFAATVGLSSQPTPLRRSQAMAAKLSRDLSNITVQLRSGQSRGANPRRLMNDEVELLKRRRDAIRAQMGEARRQRISARVNAHTTQQSDRVIAASVDHSNGVIAAVTAAVTAAKSEILDAQQPQPAHWDNAGLDDLKQCIRTELQRVGEGARSNAGVKRAKLVGTRVVAAQPDEDMLKDEVFEICHVESQTWADGAKHTVCIIKSEGKPSLSREFSSLILHDAFIARDATQSVRVVVVPHQVEHAQFHTGWRGVVQAAKATAQNVKVIFAFLKMGKIAHVAMLVPRTALRILGDDDISMTPNRHPWLGRRVTALETGQAGEIVDVNNRGRVRFKIEGPDKRKGIFFIETKSSSFEALFSEQPGTAARVSPDAPPAAEVESQATPQQPQAVEVEPTDSQEAAQSLADSDALSEGAALTPGSNEPTSAPIAPAKRKKGEKQPAKAAAVKRRPASTNLSAPKRRRNCFSLGNVD